jgi:hypothetical protein
MQDFDTFFIIKLQASADTIYYCGPYYNWVDAVTASTDGIEVLCLLNLGLIPYDPVKANIIECLKTGNTIEEINVRAENIYSSLQTKATS